jgi:hypothetical protein
VDGQVVRQVSPVKQMSVEVKAEVVALVPRSEEAKKFVVVPLVPWMVAAKREVEVAFVVVLLVAKVDDALMFVAFTLVAPRLVLVADVDCSVEANSDDVVALLVSHSVQ